MSDDPSQQKTLSQTEMDALLLQARQLGILLLKTPHADGPGVPGCWLGGEPTLPPEIDWP